MSALPKTRVPREFDRVASGYDLLTGLNPGYRRHLRLSARRLAIGEDARVLDLCCGTGQSTQAILAEQPTARVVGLDASPGMLSVARSRLAELPVDWIEGDAMDPAAVGAHGPFDAILMAYGIRNMPEPDLCLSRLLGLLRPGGSVCFHEYSVADSLRARLIWKAVTSFLIVPAGFVVSGDTTLYRYLRRSVLDFDGVRQFEDRLRRAGFAEVRTEPMDGWQRGIVHSFLARRPVAEP